MQRLQGYVYDFSIGYDSTVVDYVFGIYKYLMKKHDVKQCLDLLKKEFSGLWRACTMASFGKFPTFNSEGHIKFVSLNNPS